MYGFETELRPSYSDEAKAEAESYFRLLKNLSLEELRALAMSCLLEQIEHGKPWLRMNSKCVQIEINRRITKRMTETYDS